MGGFIPNKQNTYKLLRRGIRSFGEEKSDSISVFNCPQNQVPLLPNMAASGAGFMAMGRRVQGRHLGNGKKFQIMYRTAIVTNVCGSEWVSSHSWEIMITSFLPSISEGWNGSKLSIDNTLYGTEDGVSKRSLRCAQSEQMHEDTLMGLITQNLAFPFLTQTQSYTSPVLCFSQAN